MCSVTTENVEALRVVCCVVAIADAGLRKIHNEEDTLLVITHYSQNVPIPMTEH